MTEERTKLVEDNIRYPYFVAHKFRNVPIEFDDLVGIANIGLVKAALQFDFESGFSFTTLADIVIRREIIHELRKQKKKKRTANVVSLETPMPGAENITIADMIPDRRDSFEHLEAALCLKNGLNNLNDKEFKAVRLSIEYPGTSQAVRARKQGISQSIYSRYLISARRKIVVTSNF
ncbi:MAG: sigma-70 family RNA polymerase sigma factor [Ruminococcus sp.]|nr:sigma-70 family RNA polymerase sigma factor [Ruminococcus sp.]